MQVHGPREVYDASEIRARRNGDFAIIPIGHVDLFLYTPAEADALIAAACEAKRLLEPPAAGCDCMADAPGGGVLLPAGCDPDTAPVLSLTAKGLAALDSAALVPAAPRVIRSAALPGGAA